MGREGLGFPFVVLGGNDVGVGVEEHGGQRGVGARPFEEDKRLGLDELEGLRLQGQRCGLRDDEIGCLVICRVRMSGVDP